MTNMSMSPGSNNVDGDGGPEHRPQWYDRGAVFFGNIWAHRAAAGIYGVVALSPLVLWAGSESQIEVSKRGALVGGVRRPRMANVGLA